MYELEHITSCGAIPYRVIHKGIQILLIRANRNKDWSMPKGKQEIGENIEETIRREVLEETGLEVQGLEERLPDIHIVREQRGYSKTVISYLAKSAPGVPNPIHKNEVAEARFFSIDKLPKLQEYQRRHILMACQRLKNQYDS